jgi:3D (Asp-Asp-Asp) domain-containing protein
MRQSKCLIGLFTLVIGLFSVSCSSSSAKPKTSYKKSSASSVASATAPTNGFYRKDGKVCAVVRTTAYSHVEADSLKYGKANAMGTTLRYDTVRSAASDWSVFPVGTVFKIKGMPNVIYRIDDYGSALVGTRTIDIYHPCRPSMNSWGVRHVEIEVLRWGSYAKSLEILNPRTKYSHVRSMVTSIKRKAPSLVSGS